MNDNTVLPLASTNIATPSSPFIDPNTFASARSDHWETTLGNVPSDKLRSLWHTMAETFGTAINQQDDQWRILQPPTGTGKTQGSILYSALVAQKNQEVSSEDRVGVLIVVRLIPSANEIADSINALAGFQCAAAKHTEAPLHVFQAEAADILVVTHAAYVKALKALCRGDTSRWNQLVSWSHGQRKLTIIDEAIENVLESYQIKSNYIKKLLLYIDTSMEMQHPKEVAAVRFVLEMLETIERTSEAAEKSKNSSAGKNRVVWESHKVTDYGLTAADIPSLDGLREALDGYRFDLATLHKTSPGDQARLKAQVEQTLTSIEEIWNQFGWYAKQGKEHSINASELLIPDNLPAPVVLDATAKATFLWRLLGDRAHIVPINRDSRNYSSVQVHVGRARGIGKTKMIELGHERIPRVLQNLQDTLPEHSKVFLCVHKAIEHLALGFDTSRFSDLSVGHWGAIDGRNDWRDFDTAVLIGLPYRDEIWATNAFFSLQGVQNNAWFDNPAFGEFKDIRQEILHRSIVVSVIQAANRIRCRKVVDGQGGCESADIYIIVPSGKRGDRIIDDLVDEMPGLKITGWDFNIDEGRVKIRRGSSHEALIRFMENSGPGEYAMTTIGKALNIGGNALKKLKSAIRNPQHPVREALADLGIALQFKGSGRSSRTVLVKG